MTPLIEAAGLTKHFPVRAGTLLHRHTIPLRAVDDVALRILPGETLGLVGESGCGKSTLGRLLIRLIPPTSGNIIFDGADITLLNPAELREKRRAMQIIFQDPYGALNPRMSVEDIVMEPLLIHGARRNAETRAAGRRHAGRWSACRPARATASRTSSPAASASASASPARWCCTRSSWCATNRCPRWMSRCRHRSSICCRTCRANSA